MTNQVSGGFIFPNLAVLSGGSFRVKNLSPYSTVDYEDLVADFSSNVARVWTQNDGAGSSRSLRVGSSTTDAAVGPNVYTAWNSSTLPVVQHVLTGGASASIWHELAASTVLTGSSGTQTVVGISPTFNQTSIAAGIALLVNPSGTFGSGGGLLQSWQLASVTQAQVNTGGGFQMLAPQIGAAGSLSWLTGTTLPGSAVDLSIFRDGSDILAQRRGTNAQAARTYFTFTDTSNYQRATIKTAAGYVEFAAETAGTGTDNLDLYLTPAGTGVVMFPGATLLRTLAALTNGAGANVGTLANAPSVGDPTKWIPIIDNGVTRYIPAW